jgi:glucosamine-phosphate N-acetyltransferase
MSEINFVNLNELLNKNNAHIEKIRHSYLLLLSELTRTGYIDTTLFVKNIEKVSSMGSIIIGYTGEVEKESFEIIASGTIIIEPKIIRDGNSVGHIEDIVVIKHMRGKGLSQKILNILKEIARENNCYKVILDCSEDVKNVYIKNGFRIGGTQMSIYFNEI